MESLLECPVCYETMKPPILQCIKGHSLCGNCCDPSKLTKCPTCRSAMSTTRNYQLEQIIKQMKLDSKVKCPFAEEGCQFVLKASEMLEHKKECRYRMFECEGKKYCGWNCNWTGPIDKICDHFKTEHTLLEFKGAYKKDLDLKENTKHVAAIDFGKRSHIFWMKSKVDVEKEKCFWVFQRIGLEKQAANFYYEFELCDGPVRKLKVSEFCEGDVREAEDIFKSEKCVSIPFNLIKNYIDKSGKINFRYRIMKYNSEHPVAALQDKTTGNIKNERV
ncbi:E3 ubiquitin-protein ligase SIAH1-like isoform X2 [Agrilus planipennis]|nr:E3 ubiquitin-protein ligase SIAH1-like isoform X2 [Agrilus planipennis]